MNTADPTYLKQAIKQMESKGVTFEAGLIDKEVATVESRWNIKFPPDLRAFLQLAMPAPKDKPDYRHRAFPNWRSNNEEDVKFIEFMLTWTLDTLLFDVERNNYWAASWSQRPTDMSEAKRLATKYINEAPKLIPIHSHAFIPSEPNEVGNPIFSMYGLDTIYWGFDLASYFAKTFKIDEPEWTATQPKRIDFWWQFCPIGSPAYQLHFDVIKAQIFVQETYDYSSVANRDAKKLELSHLNISDVHIQNLNTQLNHICQLYSAEQNSIMWDSETFAASFRSVQTICYQINLEAFNQYSVNMPPTKNITTPSIPEINKLFRKRNN